MKVQFTKLNVKALEAGPSSRLHKYQVREEMPREEKEGAESVCSPGRGSPVSWRHVEAQPRKSGGQASSRFISAHLV